MTTIHLLIDDDFIDGFVQSLPRDKVTIIEKDFEENRVLLQEALQNYTDATESFIPYQDSMEDLSSWLSTKESE